MKKTIFLIFLMAGTACLQAQSIKNEDAKPKYLPANLADSYLNFIVVSKDQKTTIDVSSLKNVRDYTFYLLKGVISDDDKESWTILKSYKNSSPGFRMTFVDKIPDKTNVMYRIMAVDKDQNIEYTPIRYLTHELTDDLKFASND